MCPFDADFMGEMDGYVPNLPKEKRPLTEKKFGDEMLATWETKDLPEDAVVTHVTLIPYRGEKGVVPWKQGKLQLPEGNVKDGETPEAAVARIAREQAGILEPTAEHLGHFRVRATAYSTTLPPDTITYRALYGLDVGGLQDFPEDPAYERRIILQRDLLAMIRERYNEYALEYVEALDKFVIERTKRALARAAAESGR